MRNPLPALVCLLGSVRHLRLRPVQHGFQYPGFFFRIDAGWLHPRLSPDALAALDTQSEALARTDRPRPGGSPARSDCTPEASRLGPDARDHSAVLLSLSGLPLVAVNRRGLFSMHACDHGVDPKMDLATWLLGMLREAGLPMPRSVSLLSYPRVLGYAFKPVSFWFLARDDGETYAIVAEVHNTFGGRHAYLLHHPPEECQLTAPAKQATNPAPPLSPSPIRAGQTLEAKKCFTVSPFCTLEGHYRFRFLAAGGRMLARIEYHDNAGMLLITSMSGKAIDPRPANMLRLALRIPWQSLGVILKIHWQAVRLYLRRVPFHGAKPSNATETAPPFSA